MLEIIGLVIIIVIILLLVFSFAAPNKPAENKKQIEITTNWEYQQEQSQKESAAEKNKEWFAPTRWLTDQEIDWATERLVQNDKFKILPAHQFHYVKETKGTAEAQAHLAFPELLQELTSFAGDLIFIPVNNPDFHWSLLVYEVKSQKFWHYDTLKGANYDYVQPLVSELLQQIQQTNSPDLAQHLVKKHEIKQNNGHDCGVAVIAIIKRMREKYQGNMINIQLGKFDFTEERQNLREQYLAENETN